MGRSSQSQAAGAKPRPLYVFNGGFLVQPRIRRILALAGYDIRIGKPGADDLIGVWGHSPTAPRGETVAQITDARIVRIEDAFLRSIRPGRDGEPPLGLMIDPRGVHFDSSQPSEIEHILATADLDDGAMLQRAREGAERLQAIQLSKYNGFDISLPPPDPGYVLVIDQTAGDASIEYGAARASTFREMLVFAQEEHPNTRIVIKAHPEATHGHRPGHFNHGHTHGLITYLDDAVSPWALFAGAVGVYTVSSQLGFEAIFAGHRPRVFGQPFYAGWGLTQDENPVARRERKLTRNQLFAGAMIMAPDWYDPCRDRLCTFEDALDHLEATVRAYREDRQGYVAYGMRLWKRGHLQKAFGREKRLAFENDPGRAAARARAEGRQLLVWADKVADLPQDIARDHPVIRLEDGFLRSRGLGAKLVPPLSLVADGAGIYYDPAQESGLERLLATGLPPGAERRAERLIDRLIRAGLSKYNLDTGAVPVLPEGRRILVPGQVEDDASIRLGAGREHTNLGLLARVRAENPDAVILYKPHPDVEARLRAGAVPDAEARAHADLIVRDADAVALVEAANEIWTMTSLLGFEALIRGKPVTCLGMPFYAGWGLTRDLFPQPERRRARPTLAALVHAALIAYPRYVDPVSGLPCPPEVIVERLARHQIPPPGRGNRWLSKLQGVFASYAEYWR
ncbi:MAG: capsular polysaccharide biosynthesis protein [Rhodobacteraceae bacterium]|nr:capsular polysaccharide biosynthesis protein [Paracoccaceae bacterium]